jgi:Ser/Thr protein kinase RdoA (MazF antagonist)
VSSLQSPRAAARGIEWPASPLVADVLRCFAQTRDATVIEFPPAGFSGAVVVRVTGKGGEFALRGWPPESLPQSRIRGLHRLLRHVAGQGVATVAVPLRDDQGETLVSRDARLWQLEPWLPGRADFWENPGEARLRSAMRRLAEWHAAAAAFVPSEAEAQWFSSHPAAPSPAVGERLERIRRLLSGGGDRLAAQLERLPAGEFREIGRRILEQVPQTATVADRLAALSHVKFPLQPCLRDVWHDHLLFTGDEVTGIIDPSACRSENVATDLARLLGSLVDDDDAQWDLALAAYRQHRPLTLDELALVQALDQSSVVLAGPTWLERGRAAGSAVCENERVIDRLRAIDRRLSRLSHRMR